MVFQDSKTLVYIISSNLLGPMKGKKEGEAMRKIWEYKKVAWGWGWEEREGRGRKKKERGKKRGVERKGWGGNDTGKEEREENNSWAYS